MNTPPTVLLVLAWDDADPAVHHVAANAELPDLPTLPLVQNLAAGQPVLALLPQLPPAAAYDAAAPAAGALNSGSRVLDLSDFVADTLAPSAEAKALNAGAPGGPNAASADAPGAPAADVRLRQPLAEQPNAGQQSPAAPYLGRADELAPPNNQQSPAAPYIGRAEELATGPATAAAQLQPAATTPAAAAAAPALGALNAATAPLFDQPEDEVGAGEAADLEALDLEAGYLPAAPAPTTAAHATLTQGLAALHRPSALASAATPAVPPVFNLSDDLHYRVIQYARFTSYVLDTNSEHFNVIYAPNWPTWLAALEVRARTRRPLVLHLRVLAAEAAAPAERGWLLELERMVLRHAHTVLVISDELQAQLLKHYPLTTARVQVLGASDADGVRAVLAAVGQSR